MWSIIRDLNEFSISHDLHYVLPTEKIHLDIKSKAFSLKKYKVHVSSMHSTGQNEHHLHYERRKPIRSIRYYLFIKCYLMHSLSTPFVQTNSTLPDRSIIIHSIIIYFTATNTLPFISLLKLVFSRFTIFSLDYDGLIDMMS